MPGDSETRMGGVHLCRSLFAGTPLTPGPPALPRFSCPPQWFLPGRGGLTHTVPGLGMSSASLSLQAPREGYQNSNRTCLFVGPLNLRETPELVSRTDFCFHGGWGIIFWGPTRFQGRPQVPAPMGSGRGNMSQGDRLVLFGISMATCRTEISWL